MPHPIDHILQQPEGTPGKGCVARFTAAKKDQSQLALIGPSAKTPSGALLLHGPRIAAPPAAREVSVQVQQDGLPPATLRGALVCAGEVDLLLAVQKLFPGRGTPGAVRSAG